MCKECGCGLPGDVAIDGVQVGAETSRLAEPRAPAASSHPDDHGHAHPHTHDHAHTHDHDHDHDHSHAHPHETHHTPSLEQRILDKNDRLAERNRGYF